MVLLFLLSDLNCSNQHWVGDGYCDDVTNNNECNYDGGDCCLDTVNTQYCTECICHDENVTGPTTMEVTGSTVTEIPKGKGLPIYTNKYYSL